jgi:CRP-like cAMP-binding protein
LLETAKLHSVAKSHFLSQLPREDQQRLLLALQPAQFGLGDTIYDVGQSPNFIYFPTTCIVSLVYTMGNGMTAEMGLVGNEGAVGIALFMGGDTMPNRATVLMAGHAMKMRARLLQEEFKRGGSLQLHLLRYIQALITQIAQTAVCNRLHSVEQRLCRWLLLCHDRARADDLLMTQELIADMLGGRRQSVSVAAGRLQDAGLIYYSRGHIRVLDRTALEAASCECYQVVKAEFDRLLGRVNRSV